MITILVATALLVLPNQSQSAAEFFARFPNVQFSPLYRESLETFLAVEEAYRRKEFAQASETLNAFWNKYPPGTEIWSKEYQDAGAISRRTGVNIGLPPCYYAVRMLDVCIEYRLRHPRSIEPNVATLSIVLVGKTRGVQPTTVAELEAGRGQEIEGIFEPALRKDNYAIIRQSLWLFEEYVEAATQGELKLRLNFVELPDLELPIRVSHRGFRLAGLDDRAWSTLWRQIAPKDLAITDWWWILYPSAVPDQYPEFASTEFITGGMGVGPDGQSPCFIIDDRWLTRKPPHIGNGPYTDIERRAYLPQWLQHEFFHHLYRIYPEHKLEVRGHDWFDRSTWPSDFKGRLEPDYYAESLMKRFLGSSPSLAWRLLYAPPSPELLSSVTIEQLIGQYRHEPETNNWHRGTIKLEPDGSGNLRWTNAAGVSWLLKPELHKGVLRIGPDCPYYKPDSRPDFKVILKRDANGRYTKEVEGFSFQGGLYRKQRVYGALFRNHQR